jgi:hypothetical protein
MLNDVTLWYIRKGHTYSIDIKICAAVFVSANDERSSFCLRKLLYAICSAKNNVISGGVGI